MKIIETNIIAQYQGVKVVRLKLQAPQIARQAQAGQFVVVMSQANSERIPLTVVEADSQKGTLVLIVQVVGLTTRLVSQCKLGSSLFAVLGPLGHPTPVKAYGTVILAGGGVGIAEIYPVARALKAAGNRIITIIGARAKELLILEKELKQISDQLRICTDDGSCGRKGVVTDFLKELLPVDLVYAVGPIPMMVSVSESTKPPGIKTLVSLNALMVDATGMCGCCRVSVGGALRFACVDGPEFDAHQVDWQELLHRTRMYSAQEQHICKLSQEGSK